MQDNDNVKPSLSSRQKRQQRQHLLDVIAMLWDDKNNPPIEGVCKDISSAGMLIELPELLSIGAHIRVSLHNHQNRQHLTSLNARVVRAHKNKWGSYTTGFEIIPDSSNT